MILLILSLLVLGLIVGASFLGIWKLGEELSRKDRGWHEDEDSF